MSMVSLKLSPKEAKEETMEVQDDKGPLYPYGTCLYLDDEAIKKLGLDAEQKKGSKLEISGWVEVVGWRKGENQGGETQSLELQITDLEVKGAAEAKPLAQKMYAPPTPAPAKA